MNLLTNIFLLKVITFGIKSAQNFLNLGWLKNLIIQINFMKDYFKGIRDMNLEDYDKNSATKGKTKN